MFNAKGNVVLQLIAGEDGPSAIMLGTPKEKFAYMSPETLLLNDRIILSASKLAPLIFIKDESNKVIFHTPMT